MIPTPPCGGVEAVERALAFIDTLGAAGRPLQLRELAARAGLAKATIMRVAASLARFDYLQKGPGRSLLAGTDARAARLHLEAVARP